MKIAPLYEVKNKLSEMVKETESGPVAIVTLRNPHNGQLELVRRTGGMP